MPQLDFLEVTIYAQLQNAPVGVDLSALDLPRRNKAEGNGEERIRVHIDTLTQLLDQQLPTDLRKEPLFRMRHRSHFAGTVIL